jgi:CRISPR-associated protein Cas1
LALLDAGVGLSLITASGRLRGRLQPSASKNIPLRHRQYQQATDKAFCQRISRSIVLAKLGNQRALARRLCRSRRINGVEAIQDMNRAIRDVRRSQDLDRLRGLEGLGARAYFRIFRQATPSEWESARRSRRPPVDPLNALLSLGYSLLTQNLMTALELVGLDPYDGFFHSDKYGRPALALDLVEEFRSLIVDSVVLSVVNKRILKLDDFQRAESGGVILKKDGLRKFLFQYTARLQTQVHHPEAARRLTYQKCFEVQARCLRRVIEGSEEEYLPFRTR